MLHQVRWNLNHPLSCIRNLHQEIFIKFSPFTSWISASSEPGMKEGFTTVATPCCWNRCRGSHIQHLLNPWCGWKSAVQQTRWTRHWKWWKQKFPKFTEPTVTHSPYCVSASPMFYTGRYGDMSLKTGWNPLPFVDKNQQKFDQSYSWSQAQRDFSGEIGC